MLKILKYLVILIVVVVGLAVAGYSFIPSSFIQNQAEKAIEDATQRDVTITGLELKRWAPLGATVTGVSIANAEWAQDPELAKIQSIEADVSVWSLITGSPSAFVLTVQQPEIYLEVDENGQANYQFETASDDSDATGEPSEPDTSEPSERSGVNIPVRPEIRVENGLVVYRNKQEGIEKQFENVSLSITQESETSPLLLKGNVDSDGKSATLDGQIANLDALASGSETDIDVKLTAPGLDFSITGAVDPTAQTTTATSASRCNSCWRPPASRSSPPPGRSPPRSC